MDNIEEVLDWYKKAHRFTNYLSAAMLYLQDNFFVEKELKSEDIKGRILGHWGTSPGLNLMYLGINYIIHKYNKDVIFIAGSGHGAPAILSNVFLEKTLTKFYPEITFDGSGISKLLKSFSWPDGFPSHTYPGVPGTIHEGGELGYSLGTAYGAVLDNPELIVVCEVGDGEAETGALATSWHGNKFINPETDGTVLPILHLNGYKISGPTIFGTMSEEEIMNYFKGLGYFPIYVNQSESVDIYIDFLQALIQSFEKIFKIKSEWQTYQMDKPLWPVIILKSIKGWTGPKFNTFNEKIEDNNLSHGIPLKNPKTDLKERKILEEWLKSYKIDELLSSDLKTPDNSLQTYIPNDSLKLGRNKYTLQNSYIAKEINLPNINNYSVDVNERGERTEDKMEKISIYLGDIIKNNPENFRIFSPDESESNLLEPVFQVTNREYIWPVRAWDKYIAKQGRMIEMLSENTLQSLMQGYILTGRYGILISYEAFLSIIASQISQYIKYTKQSNNIVWRKPFPSITYLSTSTLWRQEHNGFTHQNPDLINTLLSKLDDRVRIYFPADVNTMFFTLEEAIKTKNKINLIVSGKKTLPKFIKFEEAKNHFEQGISIWDWASIQGEPDIVLASAGDYQTEEVIAAISLLRKLTPELKIRYINVNEISVNGFGKFNKFNNNEDYNKLFTYDKEIIFNFHGYSSVIKQLIFNLDIAKRINILGYMEQGTTTTPFDMQVRNSTSRYHIAILAINAAAKINKSVKDLKEKAIDLLNLKLEEHKGYIVKYGEDMPEIRNWKWN